MPAGVENQFKVRQSIASAFSLPAQTQPGDLALRIFNPAGCFLPSTPVWRTEMRLEATQDQQRLASRGTLGKGRLTSGNATLKRRLGLMVLRLMKRSHLNPPLSWGVRGALRDPAL